MRILIAEDDASLGGFCSQRSGSGALCRGRIVRREQARALASELDYDLVVLDLNLPRLDGVAILKDVRSRKADLPILVLTGRGRIEDRVHASTVAPTTTSSSLFPSRNYRPESGPYCEEVACPLNPCSRSRTSSWTGLKGGVRGEAALLSSLPTHRLSLRPSLLSFREVSSDFDPKSERKLLRCSYLARVSRVLFGSIATRFVPAGAVKWNDVSLPSTKTWPRRVCLLPKTA
jgi:CheY-like chemotaxis protein